MGSTIRADLEPVTGLADDLAGKLMDDMLDDISTKVTKDMLKVGQKATGGDLRLSRYRGRTKMDVDVKVSGKRSTIDLTPPGMWALATGGAKPHFIGPGSRTRGGKPRKRHPGFRARTSLDPVYRTIPDTCIDVIEDALEERLN